MFPKIYPYHCKNKFCKSTKLSKRNDTILYIAFNAQTLEFRQHTDTQNSRELLRVLLSYLHKRVAGHYARSFFISKS